MPPGMGSRVCFESIDFRPRRVMACFGDGSGARAAFLSLARHACFCLAREAVNEPIIPHTSHNEAKPQLSVFRRATVHGGLGLIDCAAANT